MKEGILNKLKGFFKRKKPEVVPKVEETVPKFEIIEEAPKIETVPKVETIEVPHIIPEPKHYWEWVRENVNENESILDIGIGDGNTWKMGKDGKHNVVGTNKKYNVTGFDIDGLRLPYKFVRGNVCDGLPFSDNEFDVSVLSNILEHTPCPQKAIVEAVRVAKRTIIVVPLGEDRQLMEHGDEMAFANSWADYYDFVPDSVFPHHAHLHVFKSFDDLIPYIKQYEILKVEIMKSDAGEQLGVVIRKLQ